MPMCDPKCLVNCSLDLFVLHNLFADHFCLCICLACVTAVSTLLVSTRCDQKVLRTRAKEIKSLSRFQFGVSHVRGQWLIHHWTVFSKAAIFRSLSGTERNVSQRLSSCSGCWYSFRVSKWRSCSLTFIWAATPSPDHFLWTFFLRHFSALQLFIDSLSWGSNS